MILARADLLLLRSLSTRVLHQNRPFYLAHLKVSLPGHQHAFKLQKKMSIARKASVDSLLVWCNCEACKAVSGSIRGCQVAPSTRRRHINIRKRNSMQSPQGLPGVDSEALEENKRPRTSDDSEELFDNTDSMFDQSMNSGGISDDSSSYAPISRDESIGKFKERGRSIGISDLTHYEPNCSYFHFLTYFGTFWPILISFLLFFLI